jgi:hypothetical protein
MTRSNLSQELGIAYYRTMSRFAQYRRNVFKNNAFPIHANLLSSKVVQEVIQ